jgi:predicted O-methyltransferase YrrM
MPKGGKVAELGTFKGAFARAILKQAHPDELHLIDIDYSQFDSTGLTGPSVHRHVGLTHEVIATFSDRYFDWVYVDADHSYAGCLRDARTAAPKIREGGFMIFNDFAHIDPFNGRYGVMRAVMDFANEARWPLAFFALDVYGLHDVALRRPD